jgi:hypothetical protein
MGMRVRQAAQQRQRQPHRQIRHIVGQNVRRVGDTNAAAAGELEVHLVVADAVDADHLQLRQRGHQRRRHPEVPAGHHAVHLRGVVRQPGVIDRGQFGADHGVAGIEPGLGLRVDGGNLQQGGHRTFLCCFWLYTTLVMPPSTYRSGR